MKDPLSQRPVLPDRVEWARHSGAVGLNPLLASFATIEGIRIISSSPGHFVFGEPPFVYFRGPMEFVARPERSLRADARAALPRLRFAWVIEGRLDRDYQLAFVLRSMDHVGVRAYDAQLTSSRLNPDVALLAIMVLNAAPSPNPSQTKPSPPEQPIQQADQIYGPLDHLDLEI